MARRETILVFDSGLGGLTVHREVAAARPGADFVYVADDAAFPYGAVPEKALVARVAGLIGELIGAHRPDIVVIACNTASTIALPELRRRFSTPFVGTVPAIKPSCATSVTRRVSVLGTEATVARDSGNTARIRNKLDSIIIPRIEFRDASIREAIDFVRQQAAANDPTTEGRRGVDIVLRLHSIGRSSEPAPVTATTTV